MAIDEGTGATLTFGSTALALTVTNLQATGAAREAIPNFHLGTTTAKTFQPGDLPDPGTIAVTFYFDATIIDELVTKLNAAAETITITYPDTSTEASSGFVTSFDSGSCTVDAMMEGTMTIKRTGAITGTPVA